MKIHEYQAKALFLEYDIPVPEGQPATTVEEAVQIAQRIGGTLWVVKAQIHAGGRGKGGGVKLARSLEEVRTAAQAILGMTLVTPQTGPEGKHVNTVLVEAGTAIAQENYLSILLDRSTSQPVLMASASGGMDIEAVAEETPEKILKLWIDPLVGIQPFQARLVAQALGMPKEAVAPTCKLVQNLYRLYWEQDCTLVEVNPLVLTSDNRVVALDAKLGFDDSALGRHANLRALRDLTEEDPLEVEASKFNLNYIKLNGQVGCMVNGAGLAMATMDIIKLYGAEPANFLDVGGSATPEAIENAFRILISDPNVRVVFINIFGGILRCDLLAGGVVAAARKLEMRQPIVIRMKGTNVDEGKRILADSGLRFEVADTMAEGAERIKALI
jgi:succinyl-CoA synthetase beta subunit